MGEFKEQKWELSDEVAVEKEWKSIQPGMRNLFIKEAFFDASEQKYTILFDDLDDEGVGMSIKYWLNTKDKNTQQEIPNNAARRTLISLGKALAGREIGIPKAESIIGGVVRGDVTYYKESKYPKIFKFYPADESHAVFATIEQFSVPDEFEL